MAGDLAKAVTDLVQAVRQGRGALLMGTDGVPIVQAAPVAGVDVEAEDTCSWGSRRDQSACADRCGTPWAEPWHSSVTCDVVGPARGGATGASLGMHGAMPFFFV